MLGIETATPQVGVAIGGHEGIIASFHSTRDRRHAETLVPAIKFLCEQAQLQLSQIGLVAVDVGPVCSPVCGWAWRPRSPSPTPVESP